MKVIKTSIDNAVGWEKNPRTTTPEDLVRLKAQVKKLGIYKPLLGFEQDGKYVILGGNMRLQVYRDLGVREVEISVVKARTEADKVALSLSDNDRAGYYDEQALAELLWEQKDAIDKGIFKIDLGGDDSLARVLETLGGDVPQTVAYGMREKPGGQVLCPNCGAVVEEGDGPSDGTDKAS